MRPALPRGFGSDNHSGAHPEVMRALAEANAGHAHSYGDDPWSKQAVAVLRQHFGAEARAFFVFNGTAANVLALRASLRPWEAVICAESAHLNVDECGAPEAIGGYKLLTCPSSDGKLTPASVERHLVRIGFEHSVQPRMISIAQPTELGTIYSVEELRALCRFAHAHGLWVHMDGARLSNAAAALDSSLAALTTEVGVDVLSLGGTKNGMLFGEAVVFLHAELGRDFKYLRKQSMQLGSKMRFIAAQFLAMFEGDLWLRSARHANAMASGLAEALEPFADVQLTQPVQANAVFARIPPALIAPLQRQSFFYIWDEHSHEVRWMTSFDTEETDIAQLAAKLAELSDRR